MSKIDFDGLARRLLSDARSLLPQWFPEGKFDGYEFVVGDIYGNKGDSLKINIHTGVWTDFADRSLGGSDLISVYAAMHNMSQGEAAKELGDGDIRNITPNASYTPKPEKKEPDWIPITPVPSDAPPLMLENGRTCQIYNPKNAGTEKEWTSFKPTLVDAYRAGDGSLLGYVIRVEFKGPKSGKITPQITYCENREGERRWCMTGFRGKRPLLGLDELMRRPLAPVMIVSGEKCRRAASELAKSYVVVTWIGGDNGWDKTDWNPIKGRNVLMWPDADRARATEQNAAMYGVAPGELIPIDRQSGSFAMWQLGHTLLAQCPTVKMIVPEGVTSDGWDCADALAEGWDWNRLKEWAKPRIIVLDDAMTRKYVEDKPYPALVDQTASAQETTVLKPVEVLPPVPKPVRTGPDEEFEESPEGVQIPRNEQGQSIVGMWHDWNLDTNSRGVPLCNVNNASKVMEMDPRLRELVWDDTFLQRRMTGNPPREWKDVDDINLTVFIQRDIGLVNMTRDIVKQAVARHSAQRQRNCVQEWLSPLKWDGKERIEEFFIRVFGADDTVYCRAAARNFFVSIVARIMQPGCKVDNMIVLEGDQGLRKSTALRKLVGDEWFAEQHESATNPKAFAEIIQGKVIVEISEMGAFSKAEVGRIKQIVTCQNDRFRNPFATYATDHPRQCVFAGTINGNDWNRDVSGARRFWPIECKKMVDINYILANREQLFAEALAIYNRVPPNASSDDRMDACADWWVMPEEETREQQNMRYVADPWEEIIQEYVEDKDRVTRQDIMHYLKIEPARQDEKANMRIGKCMIRLGWVRKQYRDAGEKHYCYRREIKK